MVSFLIFLLFVGICKNGLETVKDFENVKSKTVLKYKNISNAMTTKIRKYAIMHRTVLKNAVPRFSIV
ncbi:hypothetical protein DWQ65_01010 [Treponema phagedenis]|uniref:Uncharacterized protein n=1 Tax=Treponema phagedenis TaxID=162 RepID=A0A0B7GQ75_TREPH|nr:hypothetical protein DWQ65_01010 [Treponema phagedenis]CEM60744.1 conserved hypothetical protein [Treponema phagedenis]